MLDAIIAASLRNRLLVVAVAIAIAVYGLIEAVRRPIDVLPDLNRPVVTVLTEAHGMVPEDVERLITWPIERAVNGAAGVFRVRSQSGEGLSVVSVDFDWGTDSYRNRQIVDERLQLAVPDLPPGTMPLLAPLSSIMGQIQIVGFLSTDGSTDPVELRRLVDRDIAPRLRSLAGVAQIVTIGGQPTELLVAVDFERLRAFGITLGEVEAAVRATNLNVAGGYLRMGAKGPIVTVPGRIATALDLAQAVVRPEPVRPVRVSDVARVEFAPAAVRLGDAGINGSPGVLVVITKQPGVDTVDLTDRVHQTLEEVRAELPEDVRVIETLFQQAGFIHRAIENVVAAVRDGAILVVIVLFLFLLNFRTTFITLTAIPLSVAVTALVFAAFDLTINTMTLGGLAVAIGTLVDDAIVDVENVFRRLHENSRAERPRTILQVIQSASSEIRKPILYGTLLVTVVYIPLFFLGGIEGKLFAPIGLAYILSVSGSLLVALTVTPVLCYYLLGRRKAASTEEYGGRLVKTVRRHAAAVVAFSVRYPMHIMAVGVALGLCAGVILFTRGATFLPPFNEGSAQVNVVLPPDTSLEVSEQYGKRLEHAMVKVPGIASVARRTGRAVGDEHAMPVSVTEAILTFDPEEPRDREDIIADIRNELKEALPGVPSATEQPLEHLLSHLLSGVNAQVAIKIRGPELSVLRRTAREIEAAIVDIPGVVDLFVEPQILMDKVAVTPRRADLARFGLSVEQLARTVELAMGGEQVSWLPVGQIRYPIRIRLEEEDRRDMQQIANLHLRADDGSLLRVADVADVGLAKTPNNIQRENVERRIVVQHNVADRSLGEVVADVERAITPIREKLAVMPGYSIHIGGQFEAQQDASRLIFLLTLVTMFVMVLILYLHFHSVTIALVVLLSRPIAFLGAVAAVVLTGQPVSVATLVGLIALLGVAARNAILYVDHTLHLVEDEGQVSKETLVRAGRERVVPVMMTALTSGIGLLPLALSAGEPGREILYPVATVMVGGLLTNTFLDFVVTPGLLWTFCREPMKQLAKMRAAVTA